MKLNLQKDEVELICNALDIVDSIIKNLKWDNPGVYREIRWCVLDHESLSKKIKRMKKK